MVYIIDTMLQYSRLEKYFSYSINVREVTTNEVFSLYNLKQEINLLLYLYNKACTYTKKNIPV